jgi:pyrophosphatase PpaX
MKDAALFDWDGTLLDSREVLLAAWHAATDEVIGRRFPVTPEEEALVFTQPGIILFPRVAGDPERAVRLTRSFQRAYEEAGTQVRAFPGVPEMLAELREGGVRIGVVTSKARRRYELDARRIGVDLLVDTAVCQEDSTEHKPHPQPVFLALERLGVPPGQAVMAGDTPVDLAAGEAAGLTVLGVAWGAGRTEALRDSGARAIAQSPGELAGLVLQKRGASEMIRS